MTVMLRACHREVVLHLFLTGLQGGDALSAELIEKPNLSLFGEARSPPQPHPIE